MKNKLIKGGVLSLGVAVVATGVVTSTIISNKNNKDHSSNALKNSVKPLSNIYNNYTNGVDTYQASGQLNPNEIVNLGNLDLTNISQSKILAIFDNLRNNYKSIPKVASFVGTFPLAKLSGNYNKQEFIDKFKEIVKNINHIGEDQGENRWFKIKKPKTQVQLDAKGTPTNVANFRPKIAEIDTSQHDIYKISLKNASGSSMAIPGASSDVTLYIHNEKGQLAGTKSFKDLIASKDIFFRDEISRKVVTNLANNSINFVDFEKNNGKVDVFLKMTADDSEMDVKAESIKKIGKIKTGYLNNDSEFGVNSNKFKNKAEPIGVYSVAMQYNPKQSREMNFSIMKGAEAEVSFTPFFKKNQISTKIKIGYKSKLTIEPKQLKVEFGILNPGGGKKTKGDNPIKISALTGKKAASVTINFGQDGSFDKDDNAREIDLEAIGVHDYSKVFFEKLVATGTPTKKSIDFVGFNDPDKAAKRILAEVFSQWLGVKGHQQERVGQSSKLSFGTYDIKHENYKHIHINKAATMHNGLKGTQIVDLIRKENQKINDILKNTGNDKLVVPPLFKPDGTLSVVTLNMRSWLYGYSEKSISKIQELTKLIKDHEKDFNSIGAQTSLNEKAEQILEFLVQQREDELIKHFKKVMLKKVYKYFGLALQKEAVKGDKIIARDAFTQIDVKVNGTLVKSIVKKQNVKLVDMGDEKASDQKGIKSTKKFYLQQVLNRVLNIINNNHFANFLVKNEKDFRKSIQKIADESTYIYLNPITKQYEVTNNLNGAEKVFQILSDILESYGISTSDWIEYSTMDANDFNEESMIRMIKEDIVKFQDLFVNQRKNLKFFGRNFNANGLDQMIVASNTRTVLKTKKALLESKKQTNTPEYKKIEKILASNLNTNASIDKFAIALKEWVISRYISKYSADPVTHVQKLWNINIKDMNYDLSKPLTPGDFGEFLNNSEMIFYITLIVLGAILSILAIIGIKTIKTKMLYAYNGSSVKNVFDGKQEQSMLKKNRALKLALVGMLVIGIAILVVGITIATGAIAPAIFIF